MELLMPVFWIVPLRIEAMKLTSGEKIELGASETLHVMSMCEENFMRTNFGLSSIINSMGYIREVEKVRDIQSKFLEGALIGRLRSRYHIGRVMCYDSVGVRNSVGIGMEKSKNEDGWDDDGTDCSSTLHGIAKEDMCAYEINEDAMSSQEIRLQAGLDALGVALNAKMASIKQTKAVQMEALNAMSDKERVLLREQSKFYTFDEEMICKRSYNLEANMELKRMCECSPWNGNVFANSKLKASIIAYMFESSMDKSEILVATDGVLVRRLHVLSLLPKHVVDNQVISMFCHMLTKRERERSFRRPKYWWIPATITRPAPGRTGIYNERERWTDWVGPIYDCEKIYIPVFERNHWFVAIMDMEERVVRVRVCLCEIPLITVLAILDEILRGMDYAFIEELREGMRVDWKFVSFAIIRDDCEVDQCEDFSCGVYVIKCMEAAYKRDRVCNHVKLDEERSHAAMKMAMGPHNLRRGYLLNRANCHIPDD
ncbi:Ulp1 protease family, C-terminal catalytic domain containing protein [Trema orientale]|uniref:Ulp1 protease family, C-terminal catalytic domain containing protein n=1 Tax=Trema orientale TaxID=63057 RepID=A0A2P5F7L6_TREOI|nr:Ulp1 protease family, C-terminal catalytic domain containing protein [Trema orientale]